MKHLCQPTIIALTIATSFLLINLTTQAQCDSKDFIALKNFYTSTNGDEWYINTGWELVRDHEVPPKVCNLNNLYGITVIAGRVAKISFNSPNNIDGKFPRNFYLLDRLTDIYITNSKLSGNIPATFGYLKNLRRITLKDNLLEGQIPFSIGFLENLQTLTLGNNQLKGNIPKQIGNCTYLNRLELYNNQIAGEIPAEIGRLKNLTILNLSHNEISGSIPIELDACEKLRYCYLNDNKLSGNLPSRMGNLSIANVRNNQLSGCYPVEIHYLCETLPKFYNRNYYFSDGNNFEATWEEFDVDYRGACFENLKHTTDHELNIQINPTIGNGLFYINAQTTVVNHPVNFKVYNLKGALVHQQNIDEGFVNNYKVNLESLSKGNYFIFVEQNDNTTSQKVVIQ